MLMAEVPPLCEQACEELGEADFKTPESQRLFRYLKESAEEGKKCSLSGLLNRIEDPLYRERIVAVMTTLDESSEREQVLRDCVMKIKKEKIALRLESLRRLITEAERRGDTVQVQAHTRAYQDLWHLSKTPGKGK